tara:strand:+ start:305 stop:1018 length:714 start_codon:yes stop_codon:yes gene_type:complete
MKRSELKESIKAEIISVLSEGTGVFGTSFRDLDKYNPEDFEAKFIKFKGDSDDNKMEVEAEREMNTPDGELKVYTVKTDDGVQSYTADQVELVEEDLNEDKSVNNPVEELLFHVDSYKKNMIEMEDVKQAFEEILRDYKDKIIANRSVTFSDIREEEKEEDDDDKAASKSAKKEKLGKQASKLSQADEDRYERIKNGLEKLKKKGDGESIKKMKAILSKKEVEELIKAKGRTKASFM